MIMQRILIVISTLQPGGAEKIAALLAESWARRGRNIKILMLDYPLAKAPQVAGVDIETGYDEQLMKMDLSSRVKRNMHALRKIREEVKSFKPDLVVSHLDETNCRTILACAGLKTPIVVVEHVDPRHFKIRKIWQLLRPLLYKFASRIIVVSAPLRGAFPDYVQDKIMAISNPLLLPDEMPLRTPEPYHIMALGRLHAQKGFDLLLQAFAKVQQEFPQAKLTIMGEGEERKNLTRQIKQLNLNYVTLFGYCEEPLQQLARAAIFAFPSRYEGFGLALGEAMAMGLPVVSADCESGPAELIAHGQNGLLVPVQNVEALADALLHLLRHPEAAARLGEAAKAVKERYSLSVALLEWEKCFVSIRSDNKHDTMQ